MLLLAAYQGALSLTGLGDLVILDDSPRAERAWWLQNKEGMATGEKQSSMFALDVFDNTDYESRLPAEWVPKTAGAWHSGLWSSMCRALHRARPDAILSYTMRPNVLCGAVWRATGAAVCIWNQRDAGMQRLGRTLERWAVARVPSFASNSRPGADFLVLTNIWTGWNEPNASSEFLSQEANQAVADNFCLIRTFEENLVMIFERCEGGGGVSPADVPGRYPLPADPAG